MARRPLQIGTWGKISRKQMGPKRWVARARYRDHDGVTRQVEAWAESGAKAEEALKSAMKERPASVGATVRPDTRLAVLGDLWLRTVVQGSSRLSTNTQQRYGEVLENYVRPGVGGLLVREATVGSLRRFLDGVAKDRGVATARLCKSVLSGMMTVAVLDDALDRNPVREVGDFESERSEVRALTLEEVQAIRADLAADKRAVRADLPDLVAVMLGTGCRIGEALAIRWADVDLENRQVALSGTVVRVKGQGLIRQDTTKGGVARVLRLPDATVALLLARSVNTLSAGDLVFPSASGGLREVSTVNWQWRQFRTRNPRWSWVSPHTFRKTVGTRVDRERGTKDAAAQLGHASEQVTTAHYVQKATLGPDLRDVLAPLVD